MEPEPNLQNGGVSARKLRISALFVVAEYESKSGMPDERRLTEIGADGLPRLKEGAGDWNAVLNLAVTYVEYLRFCDDVDLFLAHGFHCYDDVRICETPTLLTQAGFKQLPVLVTKTHLDHILAPESKGGHEISPNLVKRLPELLAEPAMLLNCPTNDEALVAVLCAVDQKRHPIIVPIKPSAQKGRLDSRETDVNMALTVFGKNNFHQYLKRIAARNDVLYVNKEKSQELERLCQNQFLDTILNLGFDYILQTPRCLVNKNLGAAGTLTATIAISAHISVAHSENEATVSISEVLSLDPNPVLPEETILKPGGNIGDD